MTTFYEVRPSTYANQGCFLVEHDRRSTPKLSSCSKATYEPRYSRAKFATVMDLAKKRPLGFFYKSTCRDTTAHRPAPPAGSLDAQCACAHADTMVVRGRRLLTVLGSAKCTFLCFVQGDLIMTMLETSDCNAAHVGALARSP